MILITMGRKYHFNNNDNINDNDTDGGGNGDDDDDDDDDGDWCFIRSIFMFPIKIADFCANIKLFSNLLKNGPHYH